MKKFIYLIFIIGCISLITSNFTVYQESFTSKVIKLEGPGIGMQKYAVDADTKEVINTIRRGEEFIYIFDGSVAGTDIRIDDTLSEELEFISLNIDGYTFEDNILKIRQDTSSSDFLIELKVKVKEDAKLGELTNIGELYITGSITTDYPCTINVTDPDLSIEKKASKEELLPGEKFSYDIKVLNNGNIDSKKITIADTVPSELEIIDKGDFTLKDNLLTYELDSLKVGEEKTFTIKAKVKANVKSNTKIKNTASIKEEGYKEITTEESVIVIKPVLSITKVVEDKTYLPKDLVEYKITIKNNGLTKSNNITVTDILSEYLTINKASDGKIEYNTVTWVVDELNAQEEITFTLSAYIKDNITKDITITNEVTAKDKYNEVSAKSEIKVIVEVENPETNYKIGMYIGIVSLGIISLIFIKYKSTKRFYKI